MTNPDRLRQDKPIYGPDWQKTVDPKSQLLINRATLPDDYEIKEEKVHDNGFKETVLTYPGSDELGIAVTDVENHIWESSVFIPTKPGLRVQRVETVQSPEYTTQTERAFRDAANRWRRENGHPEFTRYDVCDGTADQQSDWIANTIPPTISHLQPATAYPATLKRLGIQKVQPLFDQQNWDPVTPPDRMWAQSAAITGNFSLAASAGAYGAVTEQLVRMFASGNAKEDAESVLNLLLGSPYHNPVWNSDQFVINGFTVKMQGDGRLVWCGVFAQRLNGAWTTSRRGWFNTHLPIIAKNTPPVS